MARPARQAIRQAPRRWSSSQPAAPAADAPRAAALAALIATAAATTVARMATAAAAAAVIFAVTAAGTAASAVQPRGQLGETTSSSAGQPLGQLGETACPTAVPERSAPPAETSGRRSVALATTHVSAVRREGVYTRRVEGNYARTSATGSFICGTIIFRSLCGAVRHLASSPLDIARQRWTFDRVQLRTSAATRQLTCPADATTTQI